MNATVRRIRGDEWAAHRAVRLRALATDPRAFGSTLERERAFAEEVWRSRTELGASSPTNALFVAESATGSLIGMGVVMRTDDGWHLFAMWVDPDWRNRGLGGGILDRCVDWFRSTAPGDRLRLDVNPEQSGAVRLYDRRGFRPTGVSRPLGHMEGEVVVEMELAALPAGRATRPREPPR